MSKICFSLLKSEIKKDTFTCGDDSIDELVESSYFPTVLQQSYAYEIMVESKVVGYYMIRFKKVKLDSFPEDISDHFDDAFMKDDITSLHIHYIAIKKEYQRRKIGKAVLRTIIAGVFELSKEWPVRVITIDAKEHLLDWYKKEGFKYLANNSEGQTGITRAMYFDCHRFPDEVNEYESMELEKYKP